MKRDKELMRAILLKAEELAPRQTHANLKIDGYDAATVAEHIRLLLESDLLNGRVLPVFGQPPQTVISGLTAKGHDELDGRR
jgi:hypothetical protein